jgi:HPt (histidine-containing phosphotransfer) domain-containing protein
VFYARTENKIEHKENTKLFRYCSGVTIMTFGEDSLQETAVFSQSIQEIRMQVQTALELVMGDSSPEMLDEMASIFLEDGMPLIEQMKTGHAKNDLTAVRQAAHALKGSSATIGLEQLAEICLAIETTSKQNEANLLGKHLITLELAYGHVEKALVTFLL